MALDSNEDNYVNDAGIELAWAMKAHDRATVHMNLISSVDPKDLRMSECDDLIQQQFHKYFPSFSVGKLTEDQLKAPEAKTKWREFSEIFKELVDEYNFGTLLRMDPEGEYDSENTILVTKIQFLAIEITRNRTGINSVLRQKRAATLANGDKS